MGPRTVGNGEQVAVALAERIQEPPTDISHLTVLAKPHLDKGRSGMSTTQLAVHKDEALQRLNERVEQLVKAGEAIQVTDLSSDVAAKQFKVQVKSYETAVNLYADADIQDAKERLSTLQTAKKMLMAPVLAVLESVERKRKAWEEDERRKAEAEQRRLQEEARVAAQKKAQEEQKERERLAAEERKRREKEIEEQRKAGEIKSREATRLAKEAKEAEERERARAASDAKFAAADVPIIEVKPNIAAVAGTASRRNWKFRIVDATKLPRKYLMPDDVEIGRMVRDTKDKTLAEAEANGALEVWSE
jgi:hypothetical protein